MRRVILVGDSFFAENVQHLLAESGEMEVVAFVSTVEQALPALAAHAPDVLIIADTDADTYNDDLSPAILLSMHRGLSIIYTSVNHNHLEIFSSRSIRASASDLLATIAAHQSSEQPYTTS